MAEEWKWFWATGAEPESFCEAASREDAIECATDDAAGNYDCITICEGRRLPLNDNFFDAERVLEQWHDYNEELQDEDGSLGVDCPSPQQRSELESALNAAFAEWRARHGLGRAWPLDTRNEEVINIAAPGA